MTEFLLRPFFYNCPNNKVHGANMGPIWGRQDPGVPHVGPMNFAIWVPEHGYNLNQQPAYNSIFVKFISC